MSKKKTVKDPKLETSEPVTESQLEDDGRTVAIIAGDLHLLRKPGMWAGRTEIAGDDVYGFQQVVEITVQTPGADLYLLGDVLDEASNLPRPITAVKRALRDFPFDERRVRYIQGQHETAFQTTYENEPWLSLVDGPEHIAGQRFLFLGLQAFVMDYFSGAFEALNMCRIPAGTEVLFLHGTIDIALPFNPHFHAENIPASVRYVFAGDYHMGGNYLLLNGGMLHYTGTTWFTGAGEPTNKSVMKVERGEGGALEVSRIPLKSRPVYLASDLYLEDATIELPAWEGAEDLPKHLRKPVIIIDTPVDIATHAKLGMLGFTHTTSGANPVNPTESQVFAEENLDNSEILERYCDKEKYPDQFEFTLDVIENTVEDAIGRLKDKLGISANVEQEAQDESETVQVNLDAVDDTEEEESVDED